MKRLFGGECWHFGLFAVDAYDYLMDGWMRKRDRFWIFGACFGGGGSMVSGKTMGEKRAKARGGDGERTEKETKYEKIEKRKRKRDKGDRDERQERKKNIKDTINRSVVL